MAEEREVNTPSGVTEKFNIAEIYDENISPERLHALAVEILDRGVTHSRFQVNLPPHLHGEWVPRDAIAVREYQSKGFKIDHEFANQNAIKEQSGEHGNIIGDVIYMTCPKVWKDILDAEKHKRFVEMNGSPSETRKQKAEEKDYTNQAKSLEKHGIGNFTTSETRNVPATELKPG
jgi:hypothetical protein